ncbi:MazG-like family protein [Haemophilus parahaemolyticus]|uniref:MazG-like family protein n=1 Tax=Haemophilus parahaemolyticus TaxID=735 RepID=UPI002493AAD6|nr:MazG-like family protein [Haemophilus parahaemolyticus]
MQFIKQIEKLAKERNLIKDSSPQEQMLKLMEKFGELCGGVAENKPDVIKDSIGDCFVVTVILCKQLNLKAELYNSVVISEFKEGKYNDSSVTEQLLEAVRNLGGIAIPINQGWSITKEWIELFCINLMLISLFEGLSFKDCVQHAYDQIKDRKGKMIDGVFVKEEDF